MAGERPGTGALDVSLTRKAEIMAGEAGAKRSAVSRWGWGLLLGAALSVLAACGDKKDSTPSGQVVARLAGEDITQLEVNAELQGMNVPASVARRDAERGALQNIITRRMLMRAADERKLAQNPQFQMQQRRTNEQLHVQALARDIASKVTKPMGDEIDRFISENPALFRERKLFILDQIQFLPPEDISKLGMESLKTMEAVEQALTGAGLEFRRQPASLDSLGANPQFVREVTALLAKNPNELFMFANPGPGGQPVMLVNRVVEARSQPFTGERARQFAERYLMNERIQKALAAEVTKQREAAADIVSYQDGWAPEPKTEAEADPKAVAAPAKPGAVAPFDEAEKATAATAAAAADPIAGAIPARQD